MNVPIRVLGIATMIFWVFLIGFIVLAAYSFKDLNFNAGEPQFSASPDGQLVFSLPLYVDNRGVCSLKDLHITTAFSDAEGSEISTASTFVPVIPHGQSTTVIHNVSLNVNDLLDNGEQYLFDDQNLEISITAGLTFAELLPAQISTNFTYPWGAPFYNFTLGQPSFNHFNTTHVSLRVPMSFENHAAFDVAGSIRVQLYDGDETFLCESQTALNVTQQSSYSGDLKFFVPIDSASSLAVQSGHFNVYFSTLFFEYGPLVIPYG